MARKTICSQLVYVLILLSLVSSRLHGQPPAYCAITVQDWPGDPVIPGATCTTIPFRFLQSCTVGTYLCSAICWDCIFGTPSASGPINLANGNTFITQTDLNIPGLGGGLSLSRTWNSQFPFGESAPTVGMFGPNWRSTYEESIFVDGSGLAKYVRPNGSIWTLGLLGAQWPLKYVMIAPANGGIKLGYDTTQWTLTFKSGEQRVFDWRTGHLLSLIDRNGNTTQLTYDSSNRLATVTDPAARHLYFSYANQSSPLVVGVSSDAGVSLSYSYDSQGRLSSVTKPDLTTVSFQYDNLSMITAVLDTNGKVLESHTYDSEFRGVTGARAGGVDAVTITYPFLVPGLP